MGGERCRVCDAPVLVMAFRGTGFCSQRCQDAPVLVMVAPKERTR